MQCQKVSGKLDWGRDRVDMLRSQPLGRFGSPIPQRPPQDRFEARSIAHQSQQSSFFGDIVIIHPPRPTSTVFGGGRLQDLADTACFNTQWVMELW